MRPKLALILHGHLPFIRHPEFPEFYEETWVFEALAECYLPLLQNFERWTAEELPWSLSLTLTPTLVAMLRDPLLQSRFEQYLESRIQLAELENDRMHFEPALRSLSQFYLERFQSTKAFYQQICRDPVGQFARHQDEGHLEILACSATHAFLPLLIDQRFLLRGQLIVGCDEYRRVFRRRPAGIWLPECAYTPELDPLLQEHSLRWFVLETHGIANADPKPRCSVYAPIITPAGLVAFGRDPISAQQVWSRQAGYPGDPRYREFHRDLAHDAEWDYVKGFLAGSGGRSYTGLKYWAVTGSSGSKAIYARKKALAAVEAHAQHFIAERARHGASLGHFMDRPPLIVSPYDAELFGTLVV
jgi:1,4-alpha-glucan branching enzyme